ncbi:hypothetical protein D3C71_1358930 [compost metagenome]
MQHGDVHAGVGQPFVHIAAVTGDDVELDARVPLPDVGHQARADHVAQRRRQAQRDLAGWRLLVVVEFGDHVVHLPQQRPQPVQQFFAVGRQRHAAAVAVEQGAAAFVFQLPDLPAQRRLGDAQHGSRF